MTEAGAVYRYGTEPAGRRAAAREADDLWRGGTAARALFRPELGGWAVVVYGPARHAERRIPPAAIAWTP